MGIWQHLRAIFLLPFVVTAAIPALLLFLTESDTGFWESAPAIVVVLVVLGVAFFALGVVLMVATISLFVTVGRGTLAPCNPPEHLVVLGIYRHVRNPMISGVLAILLGEARLAASLPYQQNVPR